ncbi:MAG: hypothetical protein OQL17_09635 [Sedimenticola sp.]|nr:hypothetical protein [Sedimenticola sp.]
MGRDTDDHKIIEMGEEKLRRDPNDTETHFTMAMAYESLGEYEKALKHNSHCLEVLPSFFAALTLAVRCSDKLKKHEDAYKFARKALASEEPPGYPDFAVKVLKLMSYIPGMKPLRTLNEETIKNHEQSKKWLLEYVAWYEGR